MSPKTKISLIVASFVLIVVGLAYEFEGRLGSGSLPTKLHQSAASALCSETDGGFNIFRKSATIVEDGASEIDSCEDTTYLTEYSCLKGEVREVSVRCPKGSSCLDGRCKTK